MTAMVEALKSQVDRLSTEERAALACYLIDSLDETEDPDAQVAWEAELASREDDIRSGRAVGEPAVTVFSRLRARYA